jgi:hypothetical protein
MRTRIGAAAAAVAFVLIAQAAHAALTPGWECIPTTAQQPVVSGGTGATPSCMSGTTPVLAPTFVSSGVGGKPTVQFANVNVQIVSGSGSTTLGNGTGNLILGYDEAPGAQTGSHDLVLGEGQSYTGVGEIVAGDHNTVQGNFSSALGGYDNVVTSGFAALLGGCSNLIGTGSLALSALCSDTVHHNHEFATVSGGEHNTASGIDASVGGGKGNKASRGCEAIPAAPGTC